MNDQQNIFIHQASSSSQLLTRRLGSRRGGFSLIEILVVVGILAVLISLAVIGFKVVGGMAKGKVTNTALENTKGIVTEYEATASGDLMDSALVAILATGGNNWRWEWADPVTGLATEYSNSRMCTPDTGHNSAGAVLATSDARLIRERLLRDETARVMKKLMTNSKNRTAVEGMPPDRVIKVRYPSEVNPANLAQLPVVMDGVAEYPVGVTYLVDGINLLDGYGRPIYFIPPGGLINVNVGYKGKGDVGDKLNYDRQVTIRATDRRAFWASAGADGNLTAGDDNVYSSPVEMK